MHPSTNISSPSAQTEHGGRSRGIVRVQASTSSSSSSSSRSRSSSGAEESSERKSEHTSARGQRRANGKAEGESDGWVRSALYASLIVVSSCFPCRNCLPIPVCRLQLSTDLRGGCVLRRAQHGGTTHGVLPCPITHQGIIVYGMLQSTGWRCACGPRHTQPGLTLHLPSLYYCLSNQRLACAGYSNAFSACPCIAVHVPAPSSLLQQRQDDELSIWGFQATGRQSWPCI